MGTQNSRSSFKNNSSNMAGNINFVASEYIINYSDSFHLVILKTNQ